MSSPAERARHAREAFKEQKERKKRGAWGGAVLARVRAVEERDRVASMLVGMPAEVVVQCVGAQEHEIACRLVCKAWHAALSSALVFVCMPHVVAHMPACDVMSMSAVSHTSMRMFASTREDVERAPCRRSRCFASIASACFAFPAGGASDGTRLSRHAHAHALQHKHSAAWQRT